MPQSKFDKIYSERSMSEQDRNRLGKILSTLSKQNEGEKLQLRLEDFSLMAAAPFVNDLPQDDRFKIIQCLLDESQRTADLLSRHVDIEEYTKGLRSILDDIIKSEREKAADKAKSDEQDVKEESSSVVAISGHEKLSAESAKSHFPPK